MSPRERTLAAVLGGVVAVGAVGGGGYAGVYVPLSERSATAQRLRDDNADKEARVRKMLKDRERLAVALKRSLPADPDTAREYDAVVNRLLRDAKVPAAAFTVKVKTVDGKSAPELAAKKPAYTRVGLEVELKKVSYATVLDVLLRYYRLNLLQQITRFTVRKTETLPPASLGSAVADRPDLTVTFVTEAIVLDGAEARRSLLPVPVGMGAAGGAAGYATLFATPEATRGMDPVQWAPVLATPDREYKALLTKDIFHGLPPGPRPELEPERLEPKDDTSRFIRLTGFGPNPDGTGTALIEDLASNLKYAVTLTRAGGKLKPEVVKTYQPTRGGRKLYDDPGPGLDISEATSSTSRLFKVVGFDRDGLVLTAPDGGSASTSRGGTGGGRDRFGGAARQGNPVSTSRPTPPAAAVVGGPAATVPEEKVFVWKPGLALSDVKELSRGDGAKVLQRATAGADPAAGADEKSSPAGAAAAGGR